MDMSLLESLADEFTPGMMFFTYEMPREISRYAGPPLHQNRYMTDF